ncbi:hypothetical protein MHB50_17100 [Siminovitchia sp. FSL H7-0308]|uniref:hypothetical protein n=1 Tax=Siminovitchia sp. FSL H7-0308 TaxID=2921432 RepID=UPI0030EE9D40
MYLFLFTIIYCLVTRLIDLSFGPALGIYLLAFGFMKGWCSGKLHDFLNLESLRSLYKKNGLKDSLTELSSLILVYANSYFIDYEPFSIFEFIYLFVVFVILYRFLFWGITRTLREKVHFRV